MGNAHRSPHQSGWEHSGGKPSLWFWVVPTPVRPASQPLSCLGLRDVALTPALGETGVGAFRATLREDGIGGRLDRGSWPSACARGTEKQGAGRYSPSNTFALKTTPDTALVYPTKAATQLLRLDGTHSNSSRIHEVSENVEVMSPEIKPLEPATTFYPPLTHLHAPVTLRCIYVIRSELITHRAGRLIA